MADELRSKGSINRIVKDWATTLNDFIAKIKGIPVSESLILQKRFLDSKIALLKQKSVEINDGYDPKELAAFKRKIDFEIRALEIQLEQVDWSDLSKVDEPPISSVLNFSPPRIFDVNKTTGLTPAVSLFLPCPPFGKNLQIFKYGIIFVFIVLLLL